MVSYFKELDDPSGYYIDLVDTRLRSQGDIELEVLPLDFFHKYTQLFSIIKNYDLLFEFNSKDKKLYLNSDDDVLDIPLDWIFSSYVNGYGLDDSGLSKNGIDKMDFLRDVFFSRYNIYDHLDDFEKYFMSIFYQLQCSDKGISSRREDVLHYLNSAKIMAEYQGKLNQKDERLFNDAIDYVKNYKIVLPHKDFNPVRVYLPNSWYITPNKHLYNTMGLDGHKEANLIYPLYYSIIKNDVIENPYLLLKKNKFFLERGCIDKITFQHYTNLKYDFVSIFTENYCSLSDLQKVIYNFNDKKTYNPKIVKIVLGVISAQAGLYSFFYHLKQNSSGYLSDLKYIKLLDMDEILVRCCGFHKVSSVSSKTITTSCINYEEEFEEYIKRGWKIDFVKPIIFNPNTKKVEEYPDDYLLIKRMHSNKY